MPSRLYKPCRLYWALVAMRTIALRLCLILMLSPTLTVRGQDDPLPEPPVPLTAGGQINYAYILNAPSLKANQILSAAQWWLAENAIEIPGSVGTPSGAFTGQYYLYVDSLASIEQLRKEGEFYFTLNIHARDSSYTLRAHRFYQTGAMGSRRVEQIYMKSYADWKEDRSFLGLSVLGNHESRYRRYREKGDKVLQMLDDAMQDFLYLLSDYVAQRGD